MKIRMLSLGILFGVAIACSTAFKYPYYIPKLPSYDGYLLAEDPKKDILFKECEPVPVYAVGPEDPEPSPSPSGTPKFRNRCVVMKLEDYFAFRDDYNETLNRLKACEEQLQ